MTIFGWFVEYFICPFFRPLTLKLQLLFVVTCYGCYGYASCMLLRCCACLSFKFQSNAHQLIRSMSSEQHNNKLHHHSNSIFPKINSFLVNTFSGSSHNQSQIHPLDVSDTVDTVGSKKAVIGGASDLTVPPTPNSRCSTQSNRSEL